MLNEEQKVEPTSENGNSTKPPVSRSYICAECGTAHSITEVIMADNGWDYTYSCKNCGDVIESNGKYYGK